MFCYKCGSKNPDDGNFCCRCGISLVPIQSQEDNNLSNNQYNLHIDGGTNCQLNDNRESGKKSGLHPVTIVGLILALLCNFLSILSGGLYVSIGGIVCSIVGLTRKGKSNKIVAIIALIISVIAFSFFVDRYQMLVSLFK